MTKQIPLLYIICLFLKLELAHEKSLKSFPFDLQSPWKGY